MVGSSSWLATYPAPRSSLLPSPPHLDGCWAGEVGRPTTSCMDEPETREGYSLPLTPPLSFSVDSGLPPSDANFQLPISGWTHWTDDIGMLHVIYADDIGLPLPPAYEGVHTMGATEAWSLAALAGWARQEATEQPDVGRQRWRRAYERGSPTALTEGIFLILIFPPL